MSFPASTARRTSFLGPLGDPVVTTYRTPKTTLEVFLPREDVLFTRLHGHVDLGAADAICAVAEQQMKLGHRIQAWHDWDTATGYDTDARQRFTAFSLEWRTSIRRVSVLTQSKLLAMGVATVNLATTLAGLTMTSHTLRAAFERELADALKAP